MNTFTQYKSVAPPSYLHINNSETVHIHHIIQYNIGLIYRTASTIQKRWHTQDRDPFAFFANFFLYTTITQISFRELPIRQTCQKCTLNQILKHLCARARVSKLEWSSHTQKSQLNAIFQLFTCAQRRPCFIMLQIDYIDFYPYLHTVKPCCFYIVAYEYIRSILYGML